jgi:FtsP/CotA-like multicopper oxidase with cupredoxin domain
VPTSSRRAQPCALHSVPAAYAESRDVTRGGGTVMKLLKVRGTFGRAALCLSFSSVGLLLASCSEDDDPVTTTTSNTLQKGLPFAEPPELVSEAGVLEAQLTAAPGELDVSGMKVRGEAFNGTFVGPTLRARPGDQMRVDLKNEIDQHTNIHYHGFHVDPGGKSDNVFRHIAPGETADYVIDLPETHEPGIYWYHSHMHFDSESQVFQGLSGMILIGDTRELLPERFRGIKRRLFGLKDLQVENGAIIAENIDSNAPTIRTVNGLVEPVLEVRPGATEVWDLANISADIFYDVAISGVPMLVIGEDGTPVEETFTAEDLVLPPGKRFEVLVQLENAGNFTLKTLAYDQGGDQYPETPLVQVKVTGDEVASIAPLGEGFALAAPDPLLEQNEVAARRTWTFTEDEETSSFFINGKEFDPERVDVTPVLGTVEEWTLRNDTSEQHPFHIHVNDFKVLSVGGKPYDAHGRQDTVTLPPGQDVKVRIPFQDFTGKFVFHCHILAHEDHGMMAVVDVQE